MSIQSEAARPFWWFAAGFGLFAVVLISMGMGPQSGGAVGGTVIMVFAGIVTRLT